MKLILPQRLDSAEPVLQVRWCLERSEHSFLKEQKAKCINVLFVITYENSSLEDRILVPIDQMLTFLNFRRPGDHTVFARIVYVKYEDSFEDVKRRILDKINNYSYKNEILNSKKTSFGNDLGSFLSDYSTGDTEFDVNIPKEHFPKDPPECLGKIVNFGYDYPAVDQCMFRRRLLVSPFKLILIFIWMILTTVIRGFISLLALSLGLRDINFEAVLRPLRDDISDVLYYTSFWNSWFFKDKYSKTRPKFYLLLHPWLYIILFFVLSLVAHKLKMTNWVLLMIILRSLKGFVFYAWKPLAYCFTVLVFISFLLNKLNTKWNNITEERTKKTSTEEYLQMMRKKEEKKYDNLYKLLACPKEKTVDLDNIPLQRRTIKLRFLRLKSKVCRPFAIKG